MIQSLKQLRCFMLLLCPRETIPTENNFSRIALIFKGGFIFIPCHLTVIKKGTDKR